jgi:protein-S-isoprenylcysteine O-methyltransferase Ste14
VASIAVPPPVRRTTLEASLDVGEKVFVIGLFVLLAFRMFRAVGLGASWLNYLQLAAEGVVVVLILLRRPAKDISLNPVDWALAVGATAGPLLIRPAGLQVAPLGPPVLAAILMIGGLGLQIIAKLTLRRSFGVAPANRGLTVGGPYRLVRHPIYLAYLMGQVGFLLLNPTVWNLSLYLVSLGLQVLRIQAEERLLAHDTGFAAFRDAVRFRLVPGLW